MGQWCLLRAPSLLPQEERRLQSVIKWAWFPREPCVFWFPSSSLALGLCALAYLMHYPTIWNALIFQTIDFRLTENMVAWRDQDCILNLLLPLCTSCLFVPHATGELWRGGEITLPAPAFENKTQQRFPQLFLSKWAPHKCVLALSVSPYCL